jgi:hypothetical protein
VSKNGEPTARFSFAIPAHRSVLVKDFLAKNNVITLKYPVYFNLFPRLKSALNGRRFCDAPDIIKKATEELKRLLQNGSQECFQHLYSLWQKCKVAQRNYFEVNVA